MNEEYRYVHRCIFVSLRPCLIFVPPITKFQGFSLSERSLDKTNLPFARHGMTGSFWRKQKRTLRTAPGSGELGLRLYVYTSFDCECCILPQVL